MEKEVSRKKIAFNSSLIGISSRIILIFINFITRSFFIRFLGQDYLGIHGVITDCISFFTLVDLGIDTAMTFHLYSVVNMNEKEKINTYLSLYKRLFHYIEVAILFIGIVGSLFLTKIINGVNISFKIIYIGYFLQLFSVECSYFAADKRAFLNAVQHKDIQIIFNTIVTIIFSVFKIILLVKHSYLLYLFISIIQNLTENILLSYYVRKYYNITAKSKNIDYKLRKDLFRDTKDILGNKIVGFVYSSTDNLVISTFLSTMLVGQLINYKLVYSSLNTLVLGLFAPLTTIIGNYLNSNNSDSDVFKIQIEYSFLRFVIALLCVVPSICLMQKFIIMFTGSENWLMSKENIILLAVDFYISCMYGSLSDYVIGLGLFKKQKYVSLMGAIVNILFSITLVRFLGILGVLIGTVLGQLVLWIGNWNILAKKIWQDKNKRKTYWLHQVLYFIITIFSVIIIEKLITLFELKNNLIDFIVKGISIELILLLFIILLFRKSYLLKFYLDFFKKNMVKLRRD